MYRTQQHENSNQQPFMQQKYLFKPQPNYTINYNNDPHSSPSRKPFQSGLNYSNSKLPSDAKQNPYPKHKWYPPESNQQSSQEKFMKHLLNLNSVSDNFNSKFYSQLKHESNKSYEQIFMEKMKGYQTLEVSDKNATSIVDHIIGTVQNSNSNKLGASIAKQNIQLRFISKPSLVPLDNKIRNKIIQVNEFFTHYKSITQNQNQQKLVGAYASYKSQVSQEKSIINQKLDQIDIYDLQNYAQVLKHFPAKCIKEKIVKNNQQNSVLTNSRKKQFFDMSSVQAKLQNASPSSNRGGQLRKIDILLIQILREKKRKGLVQDYFSVMQMKLVQLLQHILQDQTEYHNSNWTLAQRMKQILKNLQSFKGKMIDGQSKVNLLRIFFEEFRNLKQERQEKQIRKKANTYKKQTYRKGKSEERQLQLESNGSKYQNQLQKRFENFADQNRNESKQRVGIPMVKNNQSLKSKINYHETMSMGSKGKKAVNFSKNDRKLQTKSVKQDEWIGDLV